MINYGVRWVGPTIIPKNGDSYVSPDKTPIYLQTGLYLGSRKPWYPNIYHFGLDGYARVLGSLL